MPLFTDREKYSLYVAAVLLVALLLFLYVSSQQIREKFIVESVLTLDRIDAESLSRVSADVDRYIEETDYSVVLVSSGGSPRTVEWIAASLAFLLENLHRSVVVVDRELYTVETQRDLVRLLKDCVIPEVSIYREGGLYRAVQRNYLLTPDNCMRLPLDDLSLRVYTFNDSLLIPVIEYLEDTPDETLDQILGQELVNSGRTPDAVVLNLTRAHPQALSRIYLLNSISDLTRQGVPVILIGDNLNMTNRHGESSIIQVPSLMTSEVASAKANFLLSNSPPDLMGQLFQVSLKGEPISVPVRLGPLSTPADSGLQDLQPDRSGLSAIRKNYSKNYSKSNYERN